MLPSPNEALIAPESLDELTRLELLIAKRADELLRRMSGVRTDWEVWHEAEEEVWRERHRGKPKSK